MFCNLEKMFSMYHHSRFHAGGLFWDRNQVTSLTKQMQLRWLMHRYLHVFILFRYMERGPVDLIGGLVVRSSRHDRRRLLVAVAAIAVARRRFW